MLFSRVLTISSLLVAPAAAASETPQRVPVSGTPQYFVRHLDRGVTSAAEGSSPGTLCFDNSIDQNDEVDSTMSTAENLADALLTAPGDELVDWGVKSCGEANLVRSLTVGYGSQAPIGIGGSMTVRVYSFTQGFGSLGTPVAEIELDELPSDGPTLLLTPRYLTLELGEQSFYLPDGPVGWSFQNSDGMTAPLLVDVQPAASTQNWIDWYTPGPATDGNLQDTFSLGAGGASNDPFENSLYMQMFEADGGQIAGVQSIDNPANLSALVALNTPVLGQTWQLGFDLAGVPGAGDATLVFLSLQPSAPVSTILGTFLISPAAIAVTIETDDQHDLPILIDPEFLGLPIFVQGIYTDGEPFLTNALVGTIGF